MKSYVIISVKVEGDVSDSLDSATEVLRALYDGGYRDTILLNTIEAPG